MKIKTHLDISLDSNYDTNKIINYLKRYFQFYFVELSLEEGQNIIYSFKKPLDTIELREKYVSDGEENYLMLFLYLVNKERFTNGRKNLSFLVADAFGVEGKRRFDSLIQISTRGLERLNSGAYLQLVKEFIWASQIDDSSKFNLREFSNMDEDASENQDRFLLGLKSQFGDAFRQYHKYIAVISADGDFIGKILEVIGTDAGKIKLFSEKLLIFSNEAAEIITQYGGSPVYIGGEDIFCFAPIACTSGSEDSPQILFNLFDLISKLDTCFYNHLGSYAKNLTIQIPTLSYGISVTYYKSPLNKSISQSLELLKQSKYDDKRTHTRNTIGIRIEKHSGQFFEAFYEKNKLTSLNNFKALVDKFSRSMVIPDIEKSDLFFNSIMHKLKDPLFATIIELIAKNKTQLAEFFKSNFNEKIHLENQSYIDAVTDLIYNAYIDYSHPQDANHVAYTSLRFIDFINKSDKES
ncbi:MAG: hypothetical protein WBP41_03835 [Saprospiraceae bacterium]